MSYLCELLFQPNAPLPHTPAPRTHAGRIARALVLCLRERGRERERVRERVCGVQVRARPVCVCVCACACVCGASPCRLRSRAHARKHTHEIEHILFTHLVSLSHLSYLHTFAARIIPGAVSYVFMAAGHEVLVGISAAARDLARARTRPRAQRAS